MSEKPSSQGLSFSYLDLNFVTTSNTFPALARQTAAWCIKETYVTMASWLKSLHADDLKGLIGIIDRHAVYGESLETIKVLAVILCVGEGGEIPETEKELWSIVNRFVAILSAESISRKGLGKVNYDKLTLTADLEPADILTVTITQPVDKIDIKVDVPRSETPPASDGPIDPMFPLGKPK